MLAGAHPAVIATAHHLTSVVSAKGGKVESLEENEGQFAETWIKYQEGIHIFAVYFLAHGSVVSEKLRRVAGTTSH